MKEDREGYCNLLQQTIMGLGNVNVLGRDATNLGQCIKALEWLLLELRQKPEENKEDGSS